MAGWSKIFCDGEGGFVDFVPVEGGGVIVDDFIDVNNVGIGLAVLVVEDDPSGWDRAKIFRNFG